MLVLILCLRLKETQVKNGVARNTNANEHLVLRPVLILDGNVYKVKSTVFQIAIRCVYLSLRHPN